MVLLNDLGCPAPGFYGENCSFLCPRNCQEGRFDITDGTCLGCIPGYKGSLCDTDKLIQLNPYEQIILTVRSLLMLLVDAYNLNVEWLHNSFLDLPF